MKFFDTCLDGLDFLDLSFVRFVFKSGKFASYTGKLVKYYVYILVACGIYSTYRLFEFIAMLFLRNQTAIQFVLVRLHFVTQRNNLTENHIQFAVCRQSLGRRIRLLCDRQLGKLTAQALEFFENRGVFLRNFRSYAFQIVAVRNSCSRSFQIFPERQYLSHDVILVGSRKLFLDLGKIFEYCTDIFVARSKYRFIGIRFVDVELYLIAYIRNIFFDSLIIGKKIIFYFRNFVTKRLVDYTCLATLYNLVCLVVENIQATRYVVGIIRQNAVGVRFLCKCAFLKLGKRRLYFVEFRKQ